MTTGMSGHEYWDQPTTGPALTISRDGVSYRMHDPGGVGRIARTLRGGAPVEPAVLDDMRALGLTGRAVDVGGGVGNHALWLAIACGLTVETFEPRLHALVAANVKLNGAPVTVHQAALGEAEGTAGWSTERRGELDPESAGDVVVRTLDSYQFADVALLKIDVEGMEAAVLRGAAGTLERCRPYVYAEAWDDTYLRAHAKLLEPLGYEYGRRFRWRQHRWDPP